MMSRLLCLVIFIAALFQPTDALAQRQKKSLIFGGEAAAKTAEKTAEKTAGEADKKQTNPASKQTRKKTTSEADDVLDRLVKKKKTNATANTKRTSSAMAAGSQKKDGQPVAGELPEPEVVVIPSKLPGTAGINLSCTLFMSANSENPDEAKMISPMILVHDWGGSMLDLAPLARHLQSVGHTVLVPDLRGHGRSTTIANQTQTIDYSEFRKSDFATMAEDLEACKKFLMQYNNEGKLNISMLSVLAVGDMCPVATAWVLRDWSYENRGRIKQGKDVQALLLVSPKRKFKTFSMSRLVKAPLLSGKNNYHIPTMMIWGTESASAKESNSIYKVMARHRPPSEAAEPVDRWAQQDLYKLELPVSEEGALLLRPNDAIYKFISMFNQQKVSMIAERFPWQSRAPKKKAK